MIIVRAKWEHMSYVYMHILMYDLLEKHSNRCAVQSMRAPHPSSFFHLLSLRDICSCVLFLDNLADHDPRLGAPNKHLTMLNRKITELDDFYTAFVVHSVSLF